MNILIIGSGGREHTLAWKIKQSPRCSKLFVAPGNPGISQIAAIVSLQVDDFAGISDFIYHNNIGLVVVGPEAPLVGGIREYLISDSRLENLKVIGPGQTGAMLEGSKHFAKEFMNRHGIPTAASKTFTKETLPQAVAYLNNATMPIVLKADGLAAGKGVIICQTSSEAIDTINKMLGERMFGKASETVVIEQFLEGIELSVFVLTDGKSYKILPEAKDYKNIGEGNTGPNTGGMGSISPVNFATREFLHKVEERIIIPTVRGINDEEIDYQGFVFIGLMNVNGEPYVIEYNVRMGDPETQVVLPRIKTDFVELLEATSTGALDQVELEIDQRTAATVVMVAGGYPGDYERGNLISGLNETPDTAQSIVFHAGTRQTESGIVTNGGRVLAVTGLGGNMKGALERAYSTISGINWEHMYYRRDIGHDLMALE